MAIEGADLIKAAAFLGAGIAMGVGAIGPGVGEGRGRRLLCPFLFHDFSGSVAYGRQCRFHSDRPGSLLSLYLYA